MGDTPTNVPSTPSPEASATPPLSLLLEDQRRRWRLGQRPLVESYLTQQPALRDDADRLLDLIYQEVLLRQQAGEAPSLDEYLQRFPDLASQLRVQFEIEPVFHAGSQAAASSTGDEPTVPQDARDAAGALPRVPGYEILGVLGRGGMGVVYQARQVALKRLVALKMIRADAAGPGQRARFQAEAEAVARLQHPHIVQIYEVAEHDGRPLLALEYVGGGSLAEQLRGTPQPPADAARLVETLARAVEHAHRHGVIHRDLKPANVLLQIADLRLQNEQPGQSAICNLQSAIPKITDFGLAKLLGDEAEQTHSEAILGTPSYMAPEQAGGKNHEVGPTADVYALGAILYELLTGRPPFRAATVLETLEQVRTQEPVPPRRLQPKLPRDLETICLKCLDKQPGRRYAGADALAEDLRRFLDGEPIRARPVGRLERARKWARRRPALAALLVLSGAVGVALVGGALAYQARRQTAARRLALTEQAVRQALDQARHTRADLLAVLKTPGGVHGLLNQPARWEAQLQAARYDWQRARDLAATAEGTLDPESTDLLRQVDEELDRDQADYRLALRLEQIRLDKAAAVDAAFGYAQAEQEYPRAFEEAGLAVAPGREAEVAEQVRQSLIKDQLLAALDDWARLAHKRKNADGCRRLLEVARRADPDPWRDQVRDPERWADGPAVVKLAEAVQADREAQARLSPSMVLMVWDFLPTGQAEPWLRMAQAVHPTDFWINFQLAHLLKAKKETLEAVGFYRVALAIRPNNAAVYNNLGNALRAQKDLPGAIDAFHKALAIQPNYAFAWNNLGNALAERKDLTGAVDAYKKALAIDPEYAFAWNNLGLALTTRRDLPGATDAFQKALALDPKNAMVWYNLGVALRAQRDLPGAVDALRKALAVDAKYADAWNLLGILLRAQNDLPGAIDALNRSLALNPKSVFGWTNLGSALRAQGDFPAAVGAYQKALALNPKFAVAWTDLGSTLVDQKDLPAAIVAYRKAIELEPENAKAHCGLGLALRDQGDFAAALGALEPGHRLGSRTPSWSYPSRDWVRECQELLALEKRLPGVLQGEAAGAADRLALADLCLRYKRRYRDAVALFTQTFAAEPQRAEDLAKAHRYHAACAAALAVRDAKPGVEEQARLRNQARAWLEADLAARARLLEQDPLTAVQIADDLQRQARAPDLAAVRDTDALAGLGDEERAAWRGLWARVEALRRQARAGYTEAERQGRLGPPQREQGHPFEMAAGKTYILDLASPQFAPTLRVEDEGGRVVARPGEGGTDDRKVHLVFRPARAGTYRIVAAAAERDGTGTYTLTVRTFPAKKD
jgi:eukaryotic-like serine/threonine-protein kinase